MSQIYPPSKYERDRTRRQLESIAKAGRDYWKKQRKLARTQTTSTTPSNSEA